MQDNTNGGIGFGGALALLFIGLKLGHVINWSWWWVLCPFWVPLTVALVIVVAAALTKVVTRRPNHAGPRTNS